MTSLDILSIGGDSILDDEAYETLDYWLGDEWRQYDVDDIVEEVCEEDEDEQLWHLRADYADLSDNDIHEIMQRNRIDYSHKLLVSTSGETIYDGFEEDEVVEALNDLARTRRWCEDDEVATTDYDDMVSALDRGCYPLMLVEIDHKANLTTKCRIFGKTSR